MGFAFERSSGELARKLRAEAEDLRRKAEGEGLPAGEVERLLREAKIKSAQASYESAEQAIQKYRNEFDRARTSSSSASITFRALDTRPTHRPRTSPTA